LDVFASVERWSIEERDMLVSASKVCFRPVELKIAAAWYVRVTFSSGREVHVNGFRSETEASDWIKGEASDWLERHGPAERRALPHIRRAPDPQIAAPRDHLVRLRNYFSNARTIPG
jgi:hypothetical protein